MVKLSEFADYDGLGLAQLVKSRKVTPQELKDASLEAIEKLNPKLNSVVAVLADQARKEIEAGLPEGPFQGVPFVIKEMIAHAAGVTMQMGSRLTEGLILPHDTELMTRFRKAGLVTVATTTTPEFGFNANTEPVLHGSTRNPWNTERSPGGSSGGSAASVAAGIAPIGHANDGGGSIRVPAACCGLVGLKPTRGRIPTGPDYGELLSGIAIEFAVTRSVRDAAALLDAVAGPDPGCYGWAEPPKTPFLSQASNPPEKLRIAWMEKPLSGVPVDPECAAALRETVKLCEELGHEMVEVAPQIDVEAHALANLRVWGANLANLMDSVAEVMGRTPSEKNLETASWATYQYGKNLSAPELLRALDIYTGVSRAVGAFFQDVDALLSPTAAQPAWPLGELNQNAPGITAERWIEQLFTPCPFTNLFNTTGLPAISLPLAWTKGGLPIGLQFAGRFTGEGTLLTLAAQLEEARPWKDKRPPVHVSNL
ncbi:amidase [Candidatus Thiosymbion oneisti]|uniref:amidase n=1 Tax=Candidatus Thiosymbion oneisti TaxID=589554 RepID=UPI000A4372AA|nr:amidase [Candidatus Thiosymbion oneisti]